MNKVVSETMLITEEATSVGGVDTQWPGIEGFQSFCRGMQEKIPANISPKYSGILAHNMAR